MFKRNLQDLFLSHHLSWIKYQEDDIRARDENLVSGVTSVMWVLLVKLMIYFSQKLDKSTVCWKIRVLL